MDDQPDAPADYVFRYPLRPEPEGPAVHSHPVTEMLRAQLAHLLDILVPTRGGSDVKVDGFRLLNGTDQAYDLFPTGSERAAAAPHDAAAGGFQDVGNASLHEPRIDLIRRQLESLLSLVELEAGGEPIRPDGFRLRSLRDWVVPSGGDPVEVFGYAGARCDADCLFCYNKGNPPSVALNAPARPPDAEYDEMMTRLRYFSPGAGTALFPSLGSTYEALAHPRILEVLRELRGKTGEVFRITTDGSTLTPERVARLADLRPVYVYLSLNSASPSRRGELMRVRRPQVAIQSLPLLRAHGVPYATVIVPWPVPAPSPVPSISAMLDDLETTVAYADWHETHLVQVNLPGYSQHFAQEKLFDIEEVWSAVVDRVRELRAGTAAPIVVMPSMYEENRHEARKNRAVVMGVVRNSPADRAGLRRGDEIQGVNGLAVSSRPQARQVLALLRESGAERAALLVVRDGLSVDVTLESGDCAYPYAPETDRHLGVVMLGTGLRPGCLEKLKALIDRSGAKHVLFLSSALVRPSFEQALAESALFGGGAVRIDIEVPRNRFFGGNIFMGDLLVVQDFVDSIREYVARSGCLPDLAVIPSSPFGLGAWRRDLTGRVYLDIERAVGVPVALLDCDTIYE